MATKIRFEFESAGFAALINTPQVAAEVLARAEAIAAAAGDGFDASAVKLNFGGSSRPGAVVVTATDEARRAEAADKRLTSAIDAGR